MPHHLQFPITNFAIEVNFEMINIEQIYFNNIIIANFSSGESLEKLFIFYSFGLKNEEIFIKKFEKINWVAIFVINTAFIRP